AVRVRIGDVVHDLPHGPAARAIRRVKLGLGETVHRSPQLPRQRGDVGDVSLAPLRGHGGDGSLPGPDREAKVGSHEVSSASAVVASAKEICPASWAYATPGFGPRATAGTGGGGGRLSFGDAVSPLS